MCGFSFWMHPNSSPPLLLLSSHLLSSLISYLSSHLSSLISSLISHLISHLSPHLSSHPSSHLDSSPITSHLLNLNLNSHLYFAIGVIRFPFSYWTKNSDCANPYGNDRPRQYGPRLAPYRPSSRQTCPDKLQEEGACPDKLVRTISQYCTWNNGDCKQNNSEQCISRPNLRQQASSNQEGIEKTRAISSHDAQQTRPISQYCTRSSRDCKQNIRGAMH